MEAFYGILIPFLGTSLGAACVFFLKKTLSDAVQRALTGFAAGVMVAASRVEPADPGHCAVERRWAGGRFSRRRWGSGSAFCFCWRWTTSSRICTRKAGRPRGRRAACSARR